MELSIFTMVVTGKFAMFFTQISEHFVHISGPGGETRI